MRTISAAFLTLAIVVSSFATLVPTAYAAPAANLDQAENGGVGNPAISPVNWVNGNLNQNNSHYVEGDSIPYRAVLTDMPVGSSVTIRIGFDIKNGGKHAIDYLTHYDRIPEAVNPTSGVSGIVGSPSTFAIPAPSTASSPVAGQPATSFNALPSGERVVTAWNATLSNVAYVTSGNLNSTGNSEATMNITFTPSASTVVIAWGGHIASRLDWGANNSAGGITGSPYHMRLKDWYCNDGDDDSKCDKNLGNIGNQDRSLSAGAILPPANLIVNKVLVNDNGGTSTVSSFSFKNNNGTSTAFEADGSNSLLVNIGSTFSIVENPAQGYTTTYSGTCSGTMTSAGATCTITNNDNPATLTVNKVIVGGPLANSPQSFSFKVNDGSAVAFEQDGSNSLTVNAGTHTVSEVVVDDYTPTYENCSNITLANGGSATCTITNTYTPRNGTLNITKILGNLFGAIASFSDFSFIVGTNPATSFEPDGTNSLSLLAGTYSVSEVQLPGFAAPIYGGDCANGSTTIIAGETKNCTITNNGIQPKLTLVKTVINNNTDKGQPVGTATTSDFTLTATGPTTISGKTGASAVTNAGVDVGLYTITEAGPTEKYNASTVCVVDHLVGEDTTTTDGTVLLSFGDVATCTVTNDDKNPTTSTITVIKELVQNFGGQKTKDQFSFKVNGGDATSFDVSGINALGEVAPGTYSITEVAAQGYETTYDGCSFTAVAGEAYTCTITNTQLAQCSDGIDNDGDEVTDYDGGEGDTGCSGPDDNNEQAGGSLTIDKQVTGENASTKQAFTFNYGWTEGLDDVALSADDEPIVISNLEPGTYTFEEINLPSRWAVESIVCTDGESEEKDHDEAQNSATINIGLDENVSCVVTNKYTPRDSNGNEENIVIRKEVTKGSDSNTFFGFDVSWLDNEGENDVVLKDGQEWDSGDLNLAESDVFSVSENELPRGWTLADVTCESSDINRDGYIYPGEFTLNDGETITCTFVNHENYDVLEGYKWNDANGNGEWDTETEQGLSGWTITAEFGEGETLSAVTGEDGYYRIKLPYWVTNGTASETNQSGWTQTYPGDNVCEFTSRKEENEDFFSEMLNYVFDEEFTSTERMTYRCDFGNQQNETPDTPGGGGGSGKRVSLGGGSDSEPEGEVLGAATSTIPVGAPNTGAGSMASTFMAILMILGAIAAAFTTKRRTT